MARTGAYAKNHAGPVGPQGPGTGVYGKNHAGPVGPMGPHGPLDMHPHASSPAAPSMPGPQAALAPAVAAKPDYMAQYQASLAASRQSIAQQLQAALTDINGNEMRAHAAIGQLPGEYQQTFGAAQGALGDFSKSLDSHQVAGGGGSQTGYSSDWLAPEKAGMNNSLAFLNAQVPTLELGATSEFANRRGQANQAALDANSALDTQNQQAMLAQAQQQAGFAHDSHMARLQAQLQANAQAGQVSPAGQGSAQWFSDQQQIAPAMTSALDTSATNVGLMKTFAGLSPAERQSFLVNMQRTHPRVAAYVKYQLALSQQSQKKAPAKAKG